LGKRGPPPEKLALLFRLKYLEEVSDEKKLAEKLGVQKKSLRRYEYRLSKKLGESLEKFRELWFVPFKAVALEDFLLNSVTGRNQA
jgi:hypothetical protein